MNPKIAKKDVHLSYCMNVHPGEDLVSVKEAIQDHTVRIQKAVFGQKTMPLELRFGLPAIKSLGTPAARKKFKAFLTERKLWANSINAFPIRNFHAKRVKELVYGPDWKHWRRVQATNALATILADLMPRGRVGTLSTVAGSFKPWGNKKEDKRRMAKGLARSLLHLAHIYKKTGRRLILALEPEPFTTLEETPEIISFFQDYLEPAAGQELVQRFAGINYDLCHQMVMGENPKTSIQALLGSGITVAKVHVSAAFGIGRAQLDFLKAMNEPKYLHQVMAKDAKGEIIGRFQDIPAFVRQQKKLNWATAYSHFHIPLFAKLQKGVTSTRHVVGPVLRWLLKAGHCRTFVVETYTHDVLVQEGVLSVPPDVGEMIIKELSWVKARL